MLLERLLRRSRPKLPMNLVARPNLTIAPTSPSVMPLHPDSLPTLKYLRKALSEEPCEVREYQTIKSQSRKHRQASFAAVYAGVEVPLPNRRRTILTDYGGIFILLTKFCWR
jgi:hypothetical protein